jgi:hypothetical protein
VQKISNSAAGLAPGLKRGNDSSLHILGERFQPFLTLNVLDGGFPELLQFPLTDCHIAPPRRWPAMMVPVAVRIVDGTLRLNRVPQICVSARVSLL